jgi:hypothetical protein
MRLGSHSTEPLLGNLEADSAAAEATRIADDEAQTIARKQNTRYPAARRGCW